MSNTPRTDAAEVTMLRLDGDADVVVAAFFARQLERELIEARSATAAMASDEAKRLLLKAANALQSTLFLARTEIDPHNRELITALYAELRQFADSQGTAAPVEEGATASGNPLLWNVHCMYQQGIRDEAWEMQWRQLLAAIEQHLQRAKYPNPDGNAPDMKRSQP